jgi:CheY-like chemotaxis protein
MANSSISSNHINKKILIIDDDPSVLRSLSLIVEDYVVVTAVSSGKQAIDLLSFQNFDVILTDYEMRNGSGLAVLSYIKEKQIKTPVIMLTGHGTKELAIKALNYNVFHFIEKPIDGKIVDKIVRLALGKKEADDVANHLCEIGGVASKLLEDLHNPIKELNSKVLELDEINQRLTPEVKHKLETIKTNSDRINDLIEQTRKKIEIKPNQLKIEEFNLTDILDELKEQCLQNLVKNKIVFIISKNFDCKIKGDQALILQSLISLINNSIESISKLDERLISLDAKLIGKHIHIILTDSGKHSIFAFPKAIMDFLFSEKKELPSLSLNFVKNVIVGHNGRFYLSESLKRTQFTIAIPAA